MKKINWNKIGWRALQVLIIILLNGCGIAILAMMFVGNGTIVVEILGIKKEISYSFFEALETTQKAGIILGEVIGLLGSVGLIKFIYTQHREDKRVEKQTKELKDERFKNL